MQPFCRLYASLRLNGLTLLLALLCCPSAWGQGQEPIDFSPEAIAYRASLDNPPPRTTLEEKVKAATAVVEGKIVARNFAQTPEGFYRLYITVEVYKIFKGKGIKDTIIIMGNENYKSDKGNTNAGFASCLEPAGKDWIGAKSITPGIAFFFMKTVDANVKTNIANNSNKPIFQFIQDWNGLYRTTNKMATVIAKPEENERYIIHHENSKSMAVNTDLIEKDIYKELQRYIGKKYKTVKKKESNRSGHKTSLLPEPVINSYSPQVLPAGILSGNQSVLTISGSNFGNSGEIVFLNANDGFTQLNIHQQFITWTNTQVTVRIASRGYNNDDYMGLERIPGSGEASITFFETPPYPATKYIDLTIKYAVRDYVDNNVYYETHLQDFDSNASNQSDITFVYDNSFYNNTLALAAFRRALNTWRKATGVRFTEICNESFDLCRDTNYGTRVKVSFNKSSTDCPTPITFQSSFATTSVAMDLGSNANQDPTGNATLKSCSGNIKAYINYMHMVFKPDNLDCRDGGAHSDCTWIRQLTPIRVCRRVHTP